MDIHDVMATFAQYVPIENAVNDLYNLQLR